MAKPKSTVQLKKSKWDQRENAIGYAFVTPYIILFIIFTGIPFLIAMGMSFVNIKFITKLDNVQFVGLANFIRMFKSKEVMESLLNTVIYSAIYVPLIMIVGFFLAVLLNKGVHMKNGIRAMIFLPYVANMVAVAVIFKILLGNQGILGQFFMSLGLSKPPLLDKFWAMPTVVVIAVWKGLGLNMITYLAALQDVPSELMEAAELDGATKWQRIRNVTIPCVSPTTFFLLISSLITSLQNFTVIQTLTNGGPGRATNVMSLSIVNTAFTKNDTSFASAQALLIFVIVMIITVIQWRGQKKWVNY